MKFINKTKNSIYVQDLNLNIPYLESEDEQFISSEDVKKSFCFQQLCYLGALDITSVEDTRIEKNLYKFYCKNKLTKNAIPNDTRSQSGSATEIIFRGQFYQSTGYAKVNKNLAINLHKQGIKVEIDPVSFNNIDVNEIEAKALSFLRRKNGKNAILLDSVVATQSSVNKQLYSILYTTVETNEASKQFISEASKYNELWVTSSFCKDSFLKSGYQGDIKIVYPIVNKNLYNQNVKKILFRPNLEGFKFLSVMSWNYRKGKDVLLKSFCKRFHDVKDVSLVLLISEKNEKEIEKIKNEIAFYKNEFGNANIYACFKSIPEHQMASFYKSFDAFVLPSRGEGFGLIYCEASMCGLPVIATNYGGVLDFLSKNNSVLLDIDYLDKPQTNIHYWDSFCMPSLCSKSFSDSLSDSMFDMYKNYSFYKNQNQNLIDIVEKKFNSSSVSYQAKTILNKIWKGIKNDSIY